MIEEGQMSDEDFINLVRRFSKVRIRKEYLPLMFESPLIMESLELIYILSRNKKLSLEDLKKIKEVFEENFKFFSESLPRIQSSNDVTQNLNNNKYSKVTLFLSVLFFSLMLFSGVGCIYSAAIFIPLLIISSMGLVLCTCLISVKRRPIEILPEIIPKLDEIYKRSKHNLDSLKKNVDKLRSFFAEKYKIKMTNVDSVYVTVADEQSENVSPRKKSVTFAPTLNELNLFNIETPESRSRANSYENNGNLRPK